MLRLLPAFVLGLFGCASVPTVHGVPNYRVVNANVGRSGQITTQEGWSYIQSLGYTDVIKLNFPTEGIDDLATATGLQVHTLSVQPEGGQDIWDDVASTFMLPDRALLAQAQAILATAGLVNANGVLRKILVHCEHGEDRTGRVIGEYRVRVSGYTKDRAFKEALSLGYHLELVGLLISWEWVSVDDVRRLLVR